MGKSAKKSVGRPKVTDNDTVVSLLITSFHNGLTVREACWQSGISHEAYYNRIRNDQQFADTMAKAQSDVLITAKNLLVKEIRGGSVSAAKWWIDHYQKTDDSSQPTEITEYTSQDEDIASLDRIIALRQLLEQDRRRGYILES